MIFTPGVFFDRKSPISVQIQTMPIKGQNLDLDAFPLHLARFLCHGIMLDTHVPTKAGRADEADNADMVGNACNADMVGTACKADKAGKASKADKADKGAPRHDTKTASRGLRLAHDKYVQEEADKAVKARLNTQKRD